MPRLTITDALREMRGLHPVNAGRLTASRIYAGFLTRPEQWVADTPTPWRERLLTGITDRFTGTITPHTPEYLVLSDRVVVVVLTVTARVVLPDYPLSALQIRHQTAAARVLRGLPRDTLRDLADARASREGSDNDYAAEYDDHPEGALRVAPAGDPTNTRWTRIGADLSAARTILARACRTEPDRVLIVTASGYGAYGHRRHRLEIPVLCAMHHLADTHHVSLAAVGDWLDIEGATTSQIEPATICAQFNASYLGAFPDRPTYIRTRMATLGWTQALAAAGIPQHFLDLRAIDRDWFRTDVRDLVADRHIEVFTREPSDTPAP